MHAPRPHDLLWGLSAAALPEEAPAWAHRVLRDGHPVVVRRAIASDGNVAVGLRGDGREQRLACEMALAAIVRQVSPEALRGEQVATLPPLLALGHVAAVLDSTGLAWGPTGGTGYQLATGVAVLHADSDLDLLLRTPGPIERPQARALLDALDQGPCRIDVQLETPAGAIALREWAGSAARVLLKSSTGARLVANPWLEQERRG